MGYRINYISLYLYLHLHLHLHLYLYLCLYLYLYLSIGNKLYGISASGDGASIPGPPWMAVMSQADVSLVAYFQTKPGGKVYNVVKTIINHPCGNGLYNLFLVIWVMVYYCFSPINPKVDQS